MTCRNLLVCVAVRLPEPPAIDGRVIDAVWKTVEPTSDFVQQQPDEGQPSTEETEVRIGYDDRALYIGIICFDREPGRIVVTQSRRDTFVPGTEPLGRSLVLKYNRLIDF